MNYISLALKISITYFLFGILWIYFSDNAINLLVKDLEKLQFLQTIKGWLFITFSSILIYFISSKLFTQIESKKEELLKSNELLEKIIENAPIIIFWKSNKGVYLGCNSKFLQLMNLSSKDELLGKVDSDFSILEKENFINDDMIVISSGQPKLNYLETITTKNKVLKILNTSKVPLFDDKGKIIGVLGVSEDITEQVNNQNKIKTQEELLIQQSKLATMGEMIANIAHQWRQPLSIISTLSTGMKLQKELNISNEEYEKESLDNINENAQYLSKTIDDFKNFFKKDNNKTNIYFKELFEKIFKLTQSRLKSKDIKIIQNNYAEIKFDTYESALIQVFINIINNSIDAFENIDEDKYIFIDVEEFNNKIVIKIKDTARGIKENIIDKIFDPYFTTKSEKQGTGIGLYMSKEIITKHLNGSIEASNIDFEYLNNSYSGAIFTISIPLNKDN
ncbi:MAG: PAS domain-containing sensor histidine kinase [Aliarcobacter sp.]